ncbi:MAG TPA: polysaccharide biosynthesis/export family protein [Caulobacteraceae bacterium]|jgi:polysaccharide export outer membrane protein|nr:polysaccharide biosynthesis/export family protein [Caulobacteraceae bacterium]
MSKAKELAVNIRTLLVQVLVGLCLTLPAPLAMAQATQAAPTAGTPMPAQGDQNYIIGPGDTVEVDLLERTDFNTKAKVGTDGMIQLPYIGAIRAADHTTQQLSKDIAAALIKGGFFSHPNLSVQVSSFAARYVTVLGAVTSPGLVPIDRAYRVSEILARVGGVKDGAADYVVLRPAKGEERHLTVKALAVGGPTEDPYVSPGDTIYSPTAELFYISGQVKSPGAYALVSDMTLRMAIGRGGGLTDLGSDHGVKITRSGKKLSKVDLDSKIEAGDVIVVGERLF